MQFSPVSVPSSLSGPNIRQCFILSDSFNVQSIDKITVVIIIGITKITVMFYVLNSTVRGPIAESTHIQKTKQTNMRTKTNKKKINE
jgi:hypothetical protein